MVRTGESHMNQNTVGGFAGRGRARTLSSERSTESAIAAPAAVSPEARASMPIVRRKSPMWSSRIASVFTPAARNFSDASRLEGLA
jgi:hypothetical protein